MKNDTWRDYSKGAGRKREWIACFACSGTGQVFLAGANSFRLRCDACGGMGRVAVPVSSSSSSGQERTP